jgi:hypothetical protein
MEFLEQMGALTCAVVCNFNSLEALDDEYNHGSVM